MNATIGVFLAEAGGPPTPSGGDVVRLMHYGGWAMFAVCLLGPGLDRDDGLAAGCPGEGLSGWSCWEPCSAAGQAPSSDRCSE